MLIKIMSVVMAVFSIQLLMLSLQSVDDPLFYFISDSPVVVAARIVLAAILVAIAFQGRFNRWFSRAATLSIGAALIVLSAVVFMVPVDYAIARHILAFDLLLLADIGIVYSIAALTLKVDPRASYLRRLTANPKPTPTTLKPLRKT